MLRKKSVYLPTQFIVCFEQHFFLHVHAILKIKTLSIGDIAHM